MPYPVVPSCTFVYHGYTMGYSSRISLCTRMEFLLNPTVPSCTIVPWYAMVFYYNPIMYCTELLLNPTVLSYTIVPWYTMGYSSQSHYVPYGVVTESNCTVLYHCTMVHHWILYHNPIMYHMGLLLNPTVPSCTIVPWYTIGYSITIPLCTIWSCY